MAKAQRDEANAQMWLGCANEQGWFGKKNFPEALKSFRKAAEQGDPDAQNDVPFKFTGKIYKVTIDLKPMEVATARENSACPVGMWRSKRK